MKHVLRAVIGWIVCYIAIAIFVGSLSDALLMIAISVICTLGISLALWIPLGYVIGWGILALFDLVFKKRSGSSGEQSGNNPPPAQQSQPLSTLSKRLDSELQAEPSLSHDQQAIAAYIRKARKKGLTTEEITTNLSKNGWSAEHIQWGVQFVAGQP